MMLTTLTPRVDNQITKKMGKKFSTYQRHIIDFISIFKIKEKENINIIL